MAKHGTDFYDKSVAQDGPIVQCEDVQIKSHEGTDV